MRAVAVREWGGRDRMELLEGYLIAYLNLDRVIQIRITSWATFRVDLRKWRRKVMTSGRRGGVPP